MDTSKFMELFDSSDEVEGDFEESEEAMRRALDASDKHFYHDISGNGTAYYRSGTRNGAGYASCTITLRQDGLAVVRATSLAIPEQHWRSMRKLCGSWNTHFKLKGLKVEDGRFVFESAPFDPVLGRFDADVACSLALSTIHHYASARRRRPSQPVVVVLGGRCNRASALLLQLPPFLPRGVPGRIRHSFPSDPSEQSRPPPRPIPLPTHHQAPPKSKQSRTRTTSSPSIRIV